MTKKENIQVFITCFFIAILFWILNALGKDYSYIINYPVEIIKAYNKKSKSSILKKKVSIEVIAKGWNLIKFKIKKSRPVKIVIKYRRRSYLTNLELRKYFKNLETFKVKKVITKKLYINK